MVGGVGEGAARIEIAKAHTPNIRSRPGPNPILIVIIIIFVIIVIVIVTLIGAVVACIA